MIKVTILPYLSPLAYHSGVYASDYLIDMVYHGLKKLKNVKVQ